MRITKSAAAFSLLVFRGGAQSSRRSGTLIADLGDGTLFHFDLLVVESAGNTAINTDSDSFMNVYSFQRIAREGER
jgi:hypothetical protein